MPALSRRQQIAMAIALHNPSKLHKANRGMAQMSDTQLQEFASTPRKGLPETAHPKAQAMAKAMSRIR